MNHEDAQDGGDEIRNLITRIVSLVFNTRQARVIGMIDMLCIKLRPYLTTQPQAEREAVEDELTIAMYKEMSKRHTEMCEEKRELRLNLESANSALHPLERECKELLEKIEKLERRNEYLEMNYEEFGRIVRELSDYCHPIRLGVPGFRHTTNLINDHKRLTALCKSYQDELRDIQEQMANESGVKFLREENRRLREALAKLEVRECSEIKS